MMGPFVTPYGESGYLLAHAVSGEMPLGMRLTLLRHAGDLADRALLAATGDQVLLAESLLKTIAATKDSLNGVSA